MKTFHRTIMAMVWVGVLLGLSFTPGPAQDGAQPVTSGQVYLPITFNQARQTAQVFGVESSSITLPHAGSMSDLGTHWLRNFAFDWARIEPVRTDPPTYDWSQVNEAGLAYAWSHQLRVIAITKYTPTWAQKYPGSFCGPPAAEALDEYAQFMQAVVRRYSQPPYNIRYWELGNEVDVPHTAPPDNVFGCWGDEDDPYYGGGYYGQMLKVVTPAIKAVDPKAQVLLGGLLLECDPEAPPAGKNCNMAKFLEGILKAGGGPYFDMVSYHSYAAYFIQQINEDYWWAERGNFYGKIDFIRRMLSAYGQAGKPLILTEVSLLCDPRYPGCDPIIPDFYERQADYVYWVYLRGWEQGLGGVVWYTYEDSGWHSSGLHTLSQPKPAFYAFKYLSETLEGAALVGPLTQFEHVTGFEFRRPGERLWIVWSSDQADHTFTLPAGVTGINDKVGAPLPLAAAITLNSPVVIHLAP